MKNKWLVTKKGILKNTVAAFIIVSDSELGAKRRAFMLYYDYKDDSSFDCIDRKEFHAEPLNGIVDDKIIICP